jgi:hypothetical protein
MAATRRPGGDGDEQRLGGAASSWNPFLMAVNASSNGDNSIAHGYEGIVYAAENGARVVSLSWGGSGGSQAETGHHSISRPRKGTSSWALPATATRTNASIRRLSQCHRGRERSQHRCALFRPERIETTAVGSDVAAPGAGVYSTFDNGVTNSYGCPPGPRCRVRWRRRSRP